MSLHLEEAWQGFDHCTTEDPLMSPPLEAVAVVAVAVAVVAVAVAVAFAMVVVVEVVVTCFSHQTSRPVALSSPMWGQEGWEAVLQPEAVAVAALVVAP
jgi:hypothetical protein